MKRRKKKERSVFNPKNVGIEGLTFWEERSKEVERKSSREKVIVDDNLKL